MLGDWRKTLSKTSVLVLLLILGIGGVSSAYAITITLAGTTIVDGTITADQFIGATNTVSESAGSATGGSGNTASGVVSTVGGGLSNFATGDGSTISGGSSHGAIGTSATVGGGAVNNANGDHSTIGGGQFNTASGEWSTIPGGISNEATGDYSFAAGRQAKAMHTGATVFADSTSADYSSTTADQFSIRASGGVRMDVSGGTVSVNGAVECDNCILGFYNISVSEMGVGNEILTLEPACEFGDKAVAGGFSLNDDDFVVTNRPIGDSAWQIRITNPSSGFTSVGYVICADYSPAH